MGIALHFLVQTKLPKNCWPTADYHTSVENYIFAVSRAYQTKINLELLYSYFPTDFPWIAILMNSTDALSWLRLFFGWVSFGRK